VISRKDAKSPCPQNYCKKFFASFGFFVSLRETIKENRPGRAKKDNRNFHPFHPSAVNRKMGKASHVSVYYVTDGKFRRLFRPAKAVFSYKVTETQRDCFPLRTSVRNRNVSHFRWGGVVRRQALFCEGRPGTQPEKSMAGHG